MDTPPMRTPEGDLIGTATEKDGRSVRLLARLAGVSEARWRQIVAGHQSQGQGRYVAVKAKASTLARMAHVLGLTADQLRAAGRGDAADQLPRIAAGQHQQLRIPEQARRVPADPDSEILALMRRIRALDRPWDERVAMMAEVLRLAEEPAHADDDDQPDGQAGPAANTG